MNTVSEGNAEGLPKKHINFPNLDGIRFMCFFLVFGFHICKMTAEIQLPAGMEFPKWFGLVEKIFKNGQLGVNFFFVLSGFLITFLLIKEKEFTGRIHVPKFYLRRILRIWPLFYLTIFIGFILFPYIAPMFSFGPAETARFSYYLFFINNFDVIQQGTPKSLLLGILWSVAVEEQFYLCWPLLMSLVPIRHMKYLCLTILLGSLTFRYLHRSEPVVLYFHTFSVIGDMALGGLMAVYTASKSRFLNWVAGLSKLEIACIYAGALFLIFFKHKIFYFPLINVFERLIIAVFFGMIIVEQNFSRASFFKFSNWKFASRLGIYTYGLYCLHFLGIYLGLRLLSLLPFHDTKAGIFVFQPIISFALSIGISLFSYHYFEKRFLAYKNRFAYIVK